MVAGIDLRLLLIGVLCGVGAFLAQSSRPSATDPAHGTIWAAAWHAFRPFASPFFNSLAHDHQQHPPPFDALTPSRRQREMDKAAAAAERVARASVVRANGRLTTTLMARSTGCRRSSSRMARR